MIVDKIRKLKQDKGFIKYFNNTSWLLLQRILRIFSGLFIGIWVTRFLGPNQFGILSYAQSFVALFAAFSSLGLNRLLTRELVRNPDQEYIILGTSLVLQTLGSIILTFFLIIGLLFIEHDPLTTQIIILLAIPTFLQSFGIIDNLYQSKVQGRYSAIVNIITIIISATIKVALIYFETSLIYFVYALILDSVILAMGFVISYKKWYDTIFSWQFSLLKAKTLLKDSWPMIMSGIIVTVYMKVDQIMIHEFLNADQVGLYAAAARLSEAWSFIPTILTTSLFPAIVNAKKNNEKLYYNRIQKLYDLMVYISLAIAIPISFISNWAVVFLYGTSFAESAPVLTLHIWGSIFIFLGVARGGWILNENLQRYSIYYLGAGMIANVVLNIFLIPSQGIVGAALATVIAQSISVLFAPLLFKKTRLSFYMMIKSLLFISLFNNFKSNND
tara:strand:- start:737 stop:2068 length:1332 start_codon:yes stop_codon:yes gene_type:complete